MLDPELTQTDVTTLFIILFICFAGIATGTTIAIVKAKKKKKNTDNKE